MAKSALEAINGCNLFGEKGASWSVVYVDIDAHNRNRSIFETMLPRESSSKGVDASLIPTLSFPAFASHEERLVEMTKANVVNRLRSKRGFKRFSRDGYLSRMEDKTKRYYDKGEIKDYEGNECEWPIFYTFMIIDGVFKSNSAQIEEYQAELRKCMYGDANGGKESKDTLDGRTNDDGYSCRSSHHNVLSTGRRRGLQSATSWAAVPLGSVCLHHCATSNRRSLAHQRIGHHPAVSSELQSA